MYQGKKISAIINCAGNGTRFGKNKLLQGLGVRDDFTSEMVMVWSVKNFLQPEIDEVIVTINQKYETLYREILLEQEKLPVRLVIGGTERYLSTLAGLKQAAGEYVLVHDGVRPFAARELIIKLLDSLKTGAKAAILAQMTTTTIKIVDPKTMMITQSLLRQESYLAQTPQLFERQLLLTCYEKAIKENYQIVSDDSELVTKYTGEKVLIVPGDERNIKITYPQDLRLANDIFQNFQSES
jgi:2-C-methyl-D-erythritol 4-phosphate cytidylyltransferase